jgi:hypothetical protein
MAACIICSATENLQVHHRTPRCEGGSDEDAGSDARRAHIAAAGPHRRFPLSPRAAYTPQGIVRVPLGSAKLLDKSLDFSLAA